MSYSLMNDYAGSDEAINNHFYIFLQKFLTLHDRYTSVQNGIRVSRDFYMSGESHAGHYIPTMAAYVHRKNEELVGPLKSDSIRIAIKGIALGNPWTDPFNQYDVSDFAHGMGLITQGQKNRLKEVNRECKNQLKMGNYNQKSCFSLLDDVVDSSSLAGSHKVFFLRVTMHLKSISIDLTSELRYTPQVRHSDT
jgi:carboxypeptidase C (cathepsin A)